MEKKKKRRISKIVKEKKKKTVNNKKQKEGEERERERRKDKFKWIFNTKMAAYTLLDATRSTRLYRKTTVISMMILKLLKAS